MSETEGFHPASHSFQELIGLSNEIERELVRLLRINLTDYRTLTALGARGPLTVSGLADLLGHSAATMTAILNRLEERGLAARDRSGPDRRRVLVSVTPSAFEQILTLMGPIMERVDEFIGTRPAGDQRAIADFLSHTNSELRRHLASLSSQEQRDD